MTALASGDIELLRYAAAFVNIRARDLAALTGRTPYVVRRRLRALSGHRSVRFGPRKGESAAGLGLLDSIVDPAKAWGDRVYYLTQRGWDECLHLGFTRERVSAPATKSNLFLGHDLAITDYHLALWRHFRDRLHWNQHRYAVYDRFGEGADDHVNADAFFYLDCGSEFPAFFLEYENIRETKYNSDGTSKLIRKLLAFVRYAEGPYQARFAAENFRVIILRATPQLAINLAQKLRAWGPPLATARFWIADRQSALSTAEYVYMTPADPGRRHSFEHRAGRLLPSEATLA